VRTASHYQQRAREFGSVHKQLATLIEQAVPSLSHSNNALLEHYSHCYTSMGFHCDQAQDLQSDSYLALYSCYQRPELEPTRRLVIQAKDTPQGIAAQQFELPLHHNSVVLWSMETDNRRFRHKIVPTSVEALASNSWLGVTLRSSRTYVTYRDGRASFEDKCTPLTLFPDAAHRQDFYRLRSRENREMEEFCYPLSTHTISPSDLVPPLQAPDSCEAL
jgi:hypothetical protein